MAAFLAGDGAIVVHLRLTPRSAADRVEGVVALSDGREVLAARVRAVPEDGAANEALVRLLAEALDVPRRSIAISAGHHARLKEVRIAGDPAILLERLQRLLR